MQSSRRTHSLVLFALTALAATAACGDAQSPSDSGRTHASEARTSGQQLRPTDPSDSFGYEGASVQSHVSQSGEFRIWWSDEGNHAVPPADEDGDGVPDYVEMVGEVADEVAAHLTTNGWKLALSDDAGSGEPLGGDELFDIYLIDFSAGDGHYSRDFCVENADGVQQCAGHFRLENDFAGLNYPSPEYAARLVLSHEYFHAVQAAYVGELPQWWSEGTATWFEEYFDAEQDDFERLTSLYFDEHTRSLDDRGRGPSDAFAYGASIFVYFLELQIGPDGIRAIFERMASGEALMEALRAEVADGFGSLREAFDAFAVYNLFTGTRAVDANGYPDAERFVGVQVEARQVDGPLNWNLDVEPLAARYLKLEFDEAITLRKTSLEGFVSQPEFIAVNADEYGSSGAMHVVSSGEAARFEPDMSPIYVVVSNGYTDERRASTLQIRRPGPVDEARDDEQPDDTSEPADQNSDEGCSTTGSDGLPGTGWVLFALGAMMLRRWKVRSVV
ncbi:MAG: MXAN_6640 family putative metalloprotease [Myxococcota bacterium]